MQRAIAHGVTDMVAEHATLICEQLVRGDVVVVLQENVALVLLADLERAVQVVGRLGNVPRKLSLVLLEDFFLLPVLSEDIFLQELLLFEVQLRWLLSVVFDYHVLWHLVLAVRNNLAELPLELLHRRVGHHHVGVWVALRLARRYAVRTTSNR